MNCCLHRPTVVKIVIEEEAEEEALLQGNGNTAARDLAPLTFPNSAADAVNVKTSGRGDV